MKTKLLRKLRKKFRIQIIRLDGVIYYSVGTTNALKLSEAGLKQRELIQEHIKTGFLSRS